MKLSGRPAFCIQQGDKRMFITFMTGGDLVELAETGQIRVDAWARDNMQGYQRDPDSRRFTEIARFLLKPPAQTTPLLPQSLVFNSRSKLKFEPFQDGNCLGALDFPQGSLPLWEVDGQHRVGGIIEAVEMDGSGRLANFPVPVVIVEGLDRFHEAIQFFMINEKQKRVSTALAQRLIREQARDENLFRQLLERGEAWQVKAIDVVDILNEKKGSPWFEKIRIPGEKKRKRIASQISFVRSLRPLLRTAPYRSFQAKEIAELLRRYWSAIESLVPEAFAEPRGHVIQKPIPGVFALHGILADVLARVPGRATQEAMEEVLSAAFAEGPEPWRSKVGEYATYGGMQGARLLEELLRAKLGEPEPKDIL